MASSAALNFGLAKSLGPNNTQGASTAITADPISPVAANGNDSMISAVMMPAKMAKKYQACCSRPEGAGHSAITRTMAIGEKAVHRDFATFDMIDSRSEVIVQASLFGDKRKPQAWYGFGVAYGLRYRKSSARFEEHESLSRTQALAKRSQKRRDLPGNAARLPDVALASQQRQGVVQRVVGVA